jgi:GDPmannose 4,6-dehydratase
VKKIALIFGVTGQDGVYLSRLLLDKGYIVHGLKRKSSFFSALKLKYIYKDLIPSNTNFKLHSVDMKNKKSVKNMIEKTHPDEIYNLASQSNVAESFEISEDTSNSDAKGVLHILQAIKNSKKRIKFYQAGTSELFGKVKEAPQNEKTPFNPRNPYGVAKLYAHWITINFRQYYKIFACNGILFNHESPLRRETFVTKKIVRALCKIKYKKQRKLFLGNLHSKRDWGHAKDYVLAMWKMLQLNKPQDFVICSGKQYSIKEFINYTSKQLHYPIKWKGRGINEKGYNIKNQCVIEINKKYFRPAEVGSLIGCYKKAKKILKWKPKHDINSLIKDMIDHELNFKENDIKKF